ncbi:MAG: hypothetical protein WCY30_03390 [Candidatus Neomarinimicrobiota bacterium]|jgi:hypothetical protein
MKKTSNNGHFTDTMVKRFVKMFQCDTARITTACDTHYLILGWFKNTKTEREAGREIGQWYKDGILIDFEYVHEEVVAHGETYDELLADAKHYKKLCKMKWGDYFKKRTWCK